MKKNEIKKILRENTHKISEESNPKIKQAVKTTTKDSGAKDNEYDKVAKLLDNDLINHAAIVRRMKGSDWNDNTEATNRSKFRKKLKKMTNDDGGTYKFDDDELGQVQKILMNFSSVITHSLGKQGK